MTPPVPKRSPGPGQVPSGDGPRLAFWLNAYNALVTHALGESPRSGHLFRHRRLFRRAATEIAGLSYTPDVIEHGLLRGNARPPYSLRRVLREGDPRLELAPSSPDPRIHFALNCGARSCPPIRVYDAETIDEELDAATRAYLRAECEVDRDAGTVTLPGLMRLYKEDFGDRAAMFEFAVAHLDKEDAAWIRGEADCIRVRFARFDWQLV